MPHDVRFQGPCQALDLTVHDCAWRFVKRTRVIPTTLDNPEMMTPAFLAVLMAKFLPGSHSPDHRA